MYNSWAVATSGNLGQFSLLFFASSFITSFCTDVSSNREAYYGFWKTFNFYLTRNTSWYHDFLKTLTKFWCESTRSFQIFSISSMPQRSEKSILQGKQFTIYGFECVLKTSWGSIYYLYKEKVESHSLWNNTCAPVSYGSTSHDCF